MNNIKYFKYKKTNAFKRFLSAYGYKLNNVVGFSFVGKKQYHGNILKIYFIHFGDGEKEYFKVVCFKNFNEYNQARLNFSYMKLSNWYGGAWVVKYKTNYDGWYNVTD